MSEELKLPLEVQTALDNLEIIAREHFGEAEFKYYAIPCTWRWEGRGKKGTHYTPITGLERYETTKDVYDKNKAESKRISMDAFLGRMKGRNYTEHKRRIEKDGYLQVLIKKLKEMEWT